MATNEEIIEKYDELVTCADGEEAYAIVGGNMDFSLREACANEKEKLVKAIIDLLKQMEKEPHAKENTEDIYDIGYITALSRAELEIEKLIKEASQ